MNARRLALAGATALAVGALTLVAPVVGPVVGAAGSASIAQTSGGGTPGYCPGRDGVTVVVDFQELGGGIVVRCAPGPVVPGYTGVDALQDAGFSPEGVRQYGLAFICRIAGKPSADQALPIDGDSDYHEDCSQTPPQAAFWGYWYAPNGGSWTFSQDGAISHDAIPGGFEGWSFSLNHRPGSSPPPGIAAKRPPHAPPTSPPPTSPPPTSHAPTHRPPTHRPPTHQPPTHQPPTHQPPTHQPPTHSSPAASASPQDTAGSPTTPAAGSGAPTSTRSAAAGGAGHGGGPESQTAQSSGPSTAAAVADPVAVGHNAAGQPVSGELPKAAADDEGSAGRTVVGVVLITLLLGAGAVAAWRRRPSLE